jgi:hypothetical protein
MLVKTSSMPKSTDSQRLPAHRCSIASVSPPAALAMPKLHNTRAGPATCRAAIVERLCRSGGAQKLPPLPLWSRPSGRAPGSGDCRFRSRSPRRQRQRRSRLRRATRRTTSLNRQGHRTAGRPRHVISTTVDEERVAHNLRCNQLNQCVVEHHGHVRMRDAWNPDAGRC